MNIYVEKEADFCVEDYLRHIDDGELTEEELWRSFGEENYATMREASQKPGFEYEIDILEVDTNLLNFQWIDAYLEVRLRWFEPISVEDVIAEFSANMTGKILTEGF